MHGRHIRRHGNGPGLGHLYVCCGLDEDERVGRDKDLVCRHEPGASLNFFINAD